METPVCTLARIFLVKNYIYELRNFNSTTALASNFMYGTMYAS